MSRFTLWFIAEHLRRMGWPKKEIFGRNYVDSRILDVVVEQSIEIAVGLGAGRPKIGLAIIADIFKNNLWTKESTSKLLQYLDTGLSKIRLNIENNTELFPWQVLCADFKVAPYLKKIEWNKLDDSGFVSVCSKATACGIFWGLINFNEMEAIFNKSKIRYKQITPEVVQHGLAVSVQYPWSSLDQFFMWCEELVQIFESVRPPLSEIPIELANHPIVSSRLK
jgi:hypothetical protein